MSLFVLKLVILIFDDLLIHFSTGIYRWYCSCVFFPFSENYMVRWVKAPHCQPFHHRRRPVDIERNSPQTTVWSPRIRDAELMITLDGEWLHMLGISQPYPCLQPLPMYGQGNLEEMVCWMCMDWIWWHWNHQGALFPDDARHYRVDVLEVPFSERGDPFYIYHIKHPKIETFLNSHCHSACEHCRGANCLTPWSLLNVIFCDCRLFMVVLVLKPHKFESRHFFCSPHQSCKSQMIRRVQISTLQFGWTVTSLSLAQRPWSRVRESILKLVWRWMDFHFDMFRFIIKIAEWIVPFVTACCRGHCYQFVALIGKVCMFIINPHLVATLNSLASMARPFAMLKLCRRPAHRKGWTMQVVATNLCFSMFNSIFIYCPCI